MVKDYTVYKAHLTQERDKIATRLAFLDTELARINDPKLLRPRTIPPYALRKEDERGHYSYLTTDYTWLPAQDYPDSTRPVLTYRQHKRMAELQTKYGGEIIHTGDLR